MVIVGWIIWGLACIILITQLPFVFHRDPGVGRLAKRFCFLIALGLIVTAFTGASKLHLIWWLPLAYFLNVALLQWSVQRKIARFEESHNFTTPEIGRDIKWTDIVRHVFRVLELDRAGTIIGPDHRVQAPSSFKPYGFLLVESPILNKSVRLPIVHRDDFLLAASVFDDPNLANTVVEEAELLVTYIPKRNLPWGLAGASHALHYVITPRGTLDRYYAIGGDEHMSHPAPEKLFGSFVWDGEIKVQVNTDPKL